jgi:SAM-dependent methyltransferase
MTEPEVIRHFDEGAERLDAAYEEPGPWGEWLRDRLATVLRVLGDGPGDVLDAGMGPGRLVAELERRGWTAWGIDASPRMVDVARARAPQAAERLAVARIEQLPFADASFDVVVSLGVLQYTEEQGAAIRELARVLRPGGRAVLSVGNSRSPCCLWREHVVFAIARVLKRRVPFGSPPPLQRSSSPGRSRLRAMIADAGLEVRRIEYAGVALLPDPLDRLFPRAAVRLSQLADRIRGPVRQLLAARMVVVAHKLEAPGLTPP